jgi:transposase
MQLVLDAVDKVRTQEHKSQMQSEDSALTKSKYLSLTNPANMTDKAGERFDQLKVASLKTGRAWASKEALRDLWGYTSTEWAKKFRRCWHFWATLSRLAPIIAAAKLIARHLPNVLIYFAHRITNAVAEGLNSKMVTNQKRACGYRNPNRFKIAVYFRCGGLNLYPATVTNTKAR